jgi:predicted  nucleic acid-binding Zn-ribbon protein
LTAPRFDALLHVQDLDTALDQHVHRRTVLPERQEVANIDAQLSALGPRLAAAVTRRDEVGGRQGALEKEMAATQARIRDVNKRLYGGTVSASRELQAMAADVEQLEARASGLEDQVLELMEEGEPLDAEVAALEGEKDRYGTERVAALERLAAAEEVVDREIAELKEQRVEAAATVPSDLIATYERLRKQLAGVGAARLVGSMCTGCHLALPATELDRIRRTPADAVVYCDQCGRILVRP